MLFGYEPEIVVFYLSLLILFLFLIQTTLYLKNRKSSLFEGNINSFKFFLMGLWALLLSIIVGSVDDILRPYYNFDIFEEAVYSIGYLIYLILVFKGITQFLINEIYIDDTNQNKIQSIDRSFKYLITLVIVLAGFSSLNFLFPNVEFPEIYFDLIEFFFGISSQLAIVIFTYFILTIRSHVEKTDFAVNVKIKSVLYLIVLQIVISVTILIAVILLVFFSQSQETDRLIEGLLFIVMDILLLISYHIVYKPSIVSR